MATSPKSSESQREAALRGETERAGAPTQFWLQNGIKLVGETIVPGASELLEGRVRKGAIALGVGLGVPALSTMLLGPVGALIGGGASIAARLLSFADSLTPDDQRHWGFRTSAMSILEERYAKGELNTEEYLQRKGALS